MPRNKPCIHIIIPVYNEGENIRRAVGEITGAVNSPHDITIVYDFEEDDTVPAVKSMIAEGRPGLLLLKNRYGRGVLNAIKSGMESAPGGAVLVMMADLSDDVSIVDAMFAKMNGGCDIVCGSRYMKGGRQIGGPVLKKMMSRAAGVSLHYLAGIPTRDITNSFKMYSSKVLEAVKIESSGGFELGMEIVIKAHLMGFSICEIPSTWRDRVAGESKFMLRKWLPKYLHWYLFALKNTFLKSSRSRPWTR